MFEVVVIAVVIVGLSILIRKGLKSKINVELARTSLQFACHISLQIPLPFRNQTPPTSKRSTKKPRPISPSCQSTKTTPWILSHAL